MINTTNGYIFEGKSDCLKSYGVVESMKVIWANNRQIVDIVCCLDGRGVPVVPAINDKSNGFIPLLSLWNKDAETLEAYITRFNRSHRPIYGKLGTFNAICSARLQYDVSTGGIIDSRTMINLYIPRDVKPLKTLTGEGNADEVGFICDKLSAVNEINGLKLGIVALKTWHSAVVQNITMRDTESREAYLLSRCRVNG